MSIAQLAATAKTAAAELALSSLDARNRALLYAREELANAADALAAANKKDIESAEQNGLEPALLDRLALGEKQLATLQDGLAQVAALPDPIGAINDMSYRPSGIQVGTMRVPLGVIGIIYESRPNVTVEAASLCIKSGNACILRGGSEALNSNLALGECLQRALERAGLPSAAVQVVPTTDRAAVGEMLKLDQYIDIIIPRGGKGLVERVLAETRIPVIKHLDGICHTYIDAHADKAQAVNIAINAKTQRYGTCNTMGGRLGTLELYRNRASLP